MSFLERLNAETPSGIAELFDLRKRSLIGLKGNVLTVVGSPTPAMTRKGAGVQNIITGSHYLTAGNPASLQLSTGTIFGVARRDLSDAARYQAIAAKFGAYGLYFNTGAESKAFGVYDYGGAAFRSSTFTESNTGLLHLFAISFQSGVVNGTSFFVDGAGKGLATTTLSTQANGLTICSDGAANQGFGGPVIELGVSNRIWTPAEHAELWTDFLKEGFVGQLARRNFVYVYPNLKAAEYVAKGIVLDTDFGSEYPAGVRRIRDLTGNYPGTITGIIVPGPNGEGAQFNGTNSVDNHGASVPLAGIANYSMEHVFSLPSNAIQFDSVWSKYDNVTTGDITRLYVLNAAPGPYKLVYNEIYTASGGNVTVTTNSACMRAGIKQHVVVVRTAAGVTIRVDGEVQPTTQVGNLSPTTPVAIATRPFIVGADSATAGWQAQTFDMLRFSPNVVMSAAEVRFNYLQNLARQLDLRVTLEDTPVSLVASVAAPGQIGPYQVVNGSWACVESSTGKRSLKNINSVNEAVSIPSNAPFGTWYYRVRTPAVGPLAEVYQMFIASQPGRYSATGQNGYMIYLNTTLVTLFRLTGAVATSMANSAGFPALTLDTEYEICINRRPSDCRFTVWIKGGGFGSVWTQIIQTPEASHITSSYINLASSSANALYPQFDPNDKGVGLFHWPGQLNPIDGELKIR